MEAVWVGIIRHNVKSMTFGMAGAVPSREDVTVYGSLGANNEVNQSACPVLFNNNHPQGAQIGICAGRTAEITRTSNCRESFLWSCSTSIDHWTEGAMGALLLRNLIVSFISVLLVKLLNITTYFTITNCQNGQMHMNVLKLKKYIYICAITYHAISGNTSDYMSSTKSSAAVWKE